MTDNPLAQDLDHILEHTRDLWEDLRGEQLFITGGTGFFGKWLVESFIWINNKLNLDSKATVLSRSPEDFATRNSHLAMDDNVSLIKGDIRTFDYPEGTYSHIIHAATDVSKRINDENSLLVTDTIVGGTRRVLDFSTVCKAKKILFVSSGAVYGKQPPDLMFISEDFNGAPNIMDLASAYGESKRMAEFLCSVYAHDHGIDVKIARCFAFVGPFLPLDSNYAIGNFIRDAIMGGPINIKSDGTSIRSYLYAADLVIWLWTILIKGKSCEAYNVGSESPFSISELANKIAYNFSDQLVIQYGSPKKLNILPDRYIPSTQKAKKDLDLQEWISMDQALEKTIKWNRSTH